MKKFVTKVLLIGTAGCAGVIFGGQCSEAASFESIKKNVEEGTGLIYNPELDGVMTHDGSLELIELLEDEKQNLDIDEPTQEMYEEAFNLVENKEVIEVVEKTLPLITTFAAGAPKDYNTKWIPYNSQEFSGSGWRYSGYQFKFLNYDANPMFGLRATKDSFYFYSVIRGNNSFLRRNTVPANQDWVYYPSKSGSAKLQGYFATYNPVRGSRYYIY